MGDRRLSRRAFLLSGVGLGGLLAALSGSRPARAWSVEQIPAQSGLGVAYKNRCGTDAYHPQIRAQLEQTLAGRAGAPGTTISATQTCPFCGCPIIVTRTLD